MKDLIKIGKYSPFFVPYTRTKSGQNSKNKEK